MVYGVYCVGDVVDVGDGNWWWKIGYLIRCIGELEEGDIIVVVGVKEEVLFLVVG